jgi:hypothetical protein
LTQSKVAGVKLVRMATKLMRAGSLLAATVLLLPLCITTAVGVPESGASSLGITAAEVSPVPGASTLGDRLFPGLGNGGYDALSYDVSLGYRVGTTKMPGAVS